ncbi:MAG TPA: hypothetical protein VGD05_07085 [Pyrinomonadaceae bacterium]
MDYGKSHSSTSFQKVVSVRLLLFCGYPNLFSHIIMGFVAKVHSVSLVLNAVSKVCLISAFCNKALFLSKSVKHKSQFAILRKQELCFVAKARFVSLVPFATKPIIQYYSRFSLYLVE